MKVLKLPMAAVNGKQPDIALEDGQKLGQWKESGDATNGGVQ